MQQMAKKFPKYYLTLFLITNCYRIYPETTVNQSAKNKEDRETPINEINTFDLTSSIKSKEAQDNLTSSSNWGMTSLFPNAVGIGKDIRIFPFNLTSTPWLLNTILSSPLKSTKSLSGPENFESNTILKDKKALRFQNDHKISNPNKNSWNFGEELFGRSQILMDREIEYSDYDGWVNNLATPSLGSSGSDLLRLSPAYYSGDDGVYKIPHFIKNQNLYEISSKIFSGPSGLISKTNKTVFFVSFTAHVINEIMNAREPACPREMIKVKMPNSASLYACLNNSMNNRDEFYTIYKRAAYNPLTGKSPNSPRIQINKVTSFLDGSSIYGGSRAWSQFVRSFENGQLKIAPIKKIRASIEDYEDPISIGMQYPQFNIEGLPMKNIPPPYTKSPMSYQRLLIFGDDRNNESPLLLTMGTIWFRWHNYLANLISIQHPEWLEEKIFNEARKWVVAIYQKIVFQDWLPELLGIDKESIPKYSGYKSHINPSISIEFEALASQYYVTMIPSTLYIGNSSNCLPKDKNSENGGALRLCNSFWSPEKFLKHSLEEIINGMITQLAEQEDNIIVPDMKEFYYGKLNGLTRSNYIVDNIVHSIDVGIPNYNEVRAALGFKRIKSFKDYKRNNPTSFQENRHYNDLLNLYDSDINNMDAWTGGMLETKNGKPGELFSLIIFNEFIRLRDGDRFWFENYNQNGLFTESEVDLIKNTSLKYIVRSITDISGKRLQENLFVLTDGDPCPPFPKFDYSEPCFPMMIVDYFEGSETTFILSFLMIVIFIISVMTIMLIWAKSKQQVTLKLMECRPNFKCKDANITAEEWMKNDHFHPVVICFNPEKLTMNIYSERKEPYSRVIKFQRLTYIEIMLPKEQTKRHRLFLLKIPNEYDHIFLFKEEASYLNFKYEIEQFIKSANVKVNFREVNKYKDIFANAFTKRDREKQLDLFFKTAFSLAFAENFNNFKVSDNGYSIANDDLKYDNTTTMDSNIGFNYIYQKTYFHVWTFALNSFYKLLSRFKSKPINQYVADNMLVGFKNDDEINAVIDKNGFNGTTFKMIDLDKTGITVNNNSNKSLKLWHLNNNIMKLTNCELTRSEFSEALSLKEDSIFVENMFALVDKDKNGRISFKEFLDFTIIFFKGSADDKARVIFDMYDSEKQGFISKADFIAMLESFVEVSGIKLNGPELTRGLETMLDSANFNGKQILSFQDFLILLGDHKHNFDELHINWEGIKVCIPKKKWKKREYGENFPLRSRRTIIKGYKKSSTNNDNHIQKGNKKISNDNIKFNNSMNNIIKPKDVDATSNVVDKTRHASYPNTKEINDYNFNITKFTDKYQPAHVATSPLRCMHKRFSKQFNCNNYDVTLNSENKCASNNNSLNNIPNVKKKRLSIKTYRLNLPQSKIAQSLFFYIRYLENYRWHVFWLSFYTLIVLGIFLDKAYSYTFEKEHTGLRRIVGYGGALSRGSASALMFCYSTILLTMCRNLITFCREIFLRHFIPFDAALQMHKYIAFLGIIFSFLHVLGHFLNFYHLSTQSPNDQLCMMRSFYHLSDETPKFHNWLYGTITGLSGILLIMVLTIIYVFALPFARRYLFNMFWKTHNLYVVFYLLTFIHGLGMMLQMSIFYLFFLGPMIIFIIDKLVSLSRKKAEIPIIRADILPSNVTNLLFKRPPNFEYKSGQWVRIALTSQGSNEYHPFTLTSAPHEDNLSLHIRAVGPWTNNLRRTFDSNFLTINPHPKILLDGPFGEGHQDWDRFQVSVLIGGGIGVTPFASILKDIVHKSICRSKMKCQKVYFLWITRTQKQFEWLTDIIKDVEENDVKNFVSVNIFITQLYQKFDLRTAMLYICERHFYKVNDRSLFTGLKAITHFGRPDFVSFFMSLQEEHPDIYKFGVFSCGPPAMTHNVENATQEMNKLNQSAFIHHFENF
ncbi:unnamed protein product [Gordionus sp. m RMFG-2023]